MPARKPTHPVKRTYKGKGLFGKLKGVFVFQPKPPKDGGKDQMKLPL